jgi:hypothetical protein
MIEFGWLFAESGVESMTMSASEEDGMLKIRIEYCAA